MDRSELSEAIIHELSALFAAEVRAAGPALLAADLDGMEQRVQQLSRRVCGALLERVLAVRAQAPTERPPCPACGGLLRLVEQARRRHLQGLTGEVTLQRPTYVCTRTACGQGYAPLDAELGLGAPTLTPRLARVACRAGSTTAFAEAAAHLEEELGVTMSGETVRRVSEALGAVAEAAQQAASAQAQQGRLPRPAQGATDVVVAVDGCQVPLDDGWHEIKVGRVAPLGPTLRHDARSGRTFLAWGPSVCCAGLESAEDFWYRVYVTACRGGLSQQTRRVVVLGDGAEWIWTRAAHFVGGPGVEVVEIVDLYHAYEHLWTVGRALFATPEAVSAWVEPLKDALYAQGAPAVLAALDALVPPDAAAADLLRTTRTYFADNAARMDYPRFVAQQLPIGSGAVESLCKSLIEARLKHAGMRWTRAGAQAVATLRALSLSGGLGGLLGQPSPADAATAVPAGPSAATPRPCPAPGRGPPCGASAQCGRGAARATPSSGGRTQGCAPAPSGRDAPLAPCPAWMGPLCLTLSQSRGAPLLTLEDTADRVALVLHCGALQPRILSREQAEACWALRSGWRHAGQDSGSCSARNKKSAWIEQSGGNVCLCYLSQWLRAIIESRCNAIGVDDTCYTATQHVPTQ